MDILNFIYGWFYYSFYYMIISFFATVMLNRLTQKLWVAPLIVNAVSILLLLVLVKTGMTSTKEASYAMYFNYMPIVFTSMMLNVTIAFSNHIKRILMNRKNCSQTV